MGLLDLARGRCPAARQRLEETLQKAQSSQLSEQVSVSNVHLAELALVEGRYTEAMAKAEQAAQIAGRRSDRRTETGARLQIVRAGLAIGDTALVDKTLGVIDISQLGSEQKAALFLAMGQREALGGDTKKAGGALDQAGRFAAEAHSGSLDLQVRLERVRLALAARDRAATSRLLQGFAGDSAQLNEIPLRLQWLELEIAGALGDKDKSRAAAHYRQALTLLAGLGSYANAMTIHALGALALAPGTESEVARAAAATARERLLAQAPPEAHTSLVQQMDRRLREEAPDDNSH
jgi:tetratricopeptide (TPR) repeat protein